jgi:hypothetical protein
MDRASLGVRVKAFLSLRTRHRNKCDNVGGNPIETVQDGSNSERYSLCCRPVSGMWTALVCRRLTTRSWTCESER